MKKMFRFISITMTMAVLCIILSSPVLAYNESAANQANIISLGEDYTAVVATDGSLWIWGRNSYNQNRSGDTSNYAKAPVKAMDNVISVNCGRYSTAVIKADNSLWMWGNNTYGQFTALETYDLTKVMDNVAAVSCGANHFAAIKVDGTLWMWGKNTSGQLGIGSTDSDIHDPVKIMEGVIAVSCGDAFTAATKSDGTLWMWGYNGKGQLGTGTRENSSTPVKVMDNVFSVSCSGGLYSDNGHTAAVKRDGTVWIWGANRYGQLGNGTNSNSNIPIQVSGLTAALPNMTTDTDPKEEHSASTTEPTSPSDSASDWAREQVDQAIAAGLVPSTLQSRYTQPITRQEFCILANAVYQKVKGDVTPTASFSDTSDPIVLKMATVGVVNGVGNNRFDPSGKLTREQAATMLYRLAAAAGKPLPDVSATFADRGYISAWASKEVGAVQAAGIMNGVGNSQFDPKGSYTMEQSIVTMLRMYHYLNQ